MDVLDSRIKVLMVTTPLIITVDPTGSIPRIMRATTDLLDRSVTLVEMSSGEEALALIKSVQCAVLVTTVELEDNIKGYQLAIEASKISPETSVIVLAESTDPELDAMELASHSPYVYMHRPVDLNLFARVMSAALNNEDIFGAMSPPQNIAAAPVDFGHLPQLDPAIAEPILDNLLTDVAAMAIVFASRNGEVITERGAVGYVDREKLTAALLPMVGTTINMGELVGGQTRTLHFYDRTDYDVFLLTVGLHQFL